MNTLTIHPEALAAERPYASRQELPQLSGFNPALAGFRGMAVLIVLMHHFTALSPATPLQAFYMHLARAGWGAVDLFFTLSGFLITGILLDSKGIPGCLRNFYARRALRILPIYFAAILLCMTNWRLIYPQGNALLMQNLAWYWTYTLNIKVALKGIFQCFDNNTLHFWSLCIEEQFYLVWPLIVLACGRRRLIAICLAGFLGALGLRVLILCSHGSIVTISSFTLCRIDSMALGGLLAILARDPRAYARVRRAARPLAWTAFALLVLLFAVRDSLERFDPIVITIGISLFSLLAMSGIALVIEPGAPGRNWAYRFLAWRPLTIAGKYSYGIYVVHNCFRFPMLDTANRIIQSVPPLKWVSSQDAILDSALRTLLCAFFSFWIAHIAWHCYEMHFLKLKKYFVSSDV